jgi:hypothetical protein
MQQRQLRLGDILDDYCPRERRLTNHAVVAMVGDDVKQTRCTTCDAEHEFKHARMPRQRRKNEPAALGAPVVAAPKKVVHEPAPISPVVESPFVESPLVDDEPIAIDLPPLESEPAAPIAALGGSDDERDDERDDEQPLREEGPVHRQLIRAQLPRLDNQPPSARPAPDFTIRQPTGRQNRFRPRQQPRSGGGGGGGQMFGNRGNGNMARDPRSGQRGPGGRPPMNAHPGKRHGGGGHNRKRSK